MQPLLIAALPAPPMSVPGPAGAMRIVVADRLALVRQGLAAMLQSAWPTAVLRPVATVEHAASMLDSLDDGLLMLDAGLPGASALLRTARGDRPGLRVLMLVEDADRDAVIGCLVAGAHGVVSKTDGFAEVQRAIESVWAGQVHVPSFLPALPLPGLAPLPVLTGRQRDVLRLLAKGQSTKDIARSLDLAVSTIKVHLAAVYRALGARNRIEAVCRAGRMSLA